MSRANDERPMFSLVFLTWNSADDIEQTLDSVFEQDFKNLEVIIVDNDSRDETVQIVRETYLDDDRVRLVTNDQNLGFSRGTNIGIEESTGKYICCYNDDTYFPEDYFSTLVEHITPHAVWTTARINHRVSEKNQTVRLLSNTCFPIPYIVDSLSGTVKVNYIPGDGVIIPRPIYEQELAKRVFDPTLPTKGEDVELALRLSKKGIPLRAVVDTCSVHPDEGLYRPTLENVFNHIHNVYARLVAYRRNQSDYLTQLAVIVSSLTVPVDVLIREFPRPLDEFRDRVPED